jgi:hypothetical protein
MTVTDQISTGGAMIPPVVSFKVVVVSVNVSGEAESRLVIVAMGRRA